VLEKEKRRSWPRQLIKKCGKNVALSIFSKNQSIALLAEKEAQKYLILHYFSKKIPKVKTYTQKAKIHPIWSQSYDRELHATPQVA
jgi:hypothetical protein